MNLYLEGNSVLIKRGSKGIGLTPADIVAGATADAMLEVPMRTLGGVSLDHWIWVVGVTPGDIINERGILFLRQQAEK